MLMRLAKKSLDLNNNLLFQIIASCCLGLLLGLICGWYSPMLAFGILIAILLGYAILRKPEIAFLGILIATSSIIYEDQLPRISVGISLHIADIALLGLFGIIIVRWLVEQDFKVVHTPLDWPLLIFFGITLISSFIALYQSSVAAEPVRRSIRVFSYYLTFFAVTNLVRERRQLNFLLNGLFLISTIVAVAMILQFILGDSVQLLPGRVETLTTQGTAYDDVTRILPPGWSTVLVSFIVILCMLVLEKPSPLLWLKLLQLGLLGLALVLTFLRSYWAALIVVLSLLVYLFRGNDRVRFIRGGLIVTLSTTIILLSVFSFPDSRATRLVSASIDRLSTLGNSETFQGQDSSLNWRVIENEYAYSSIAEHPFIGLGMGVRYRPWDSRLDSRNPDGSVAIDGRSFIHNGHFRILLQSGFIGYLSLIWFSLVFLLRGFGNWQKIADNRMKATVLGFSLVYLAILIAAVANSTFMQWRWIPLIGIMAGFNEVIFRWYCPPGTSNKNKAKNF